MNGSKRRFLIAENEYLIALDAGNVLSEVFHGEISTCTKSEYPSVLSDAAWDAVILDAAGSDADVANARLALAGGAAVIFLSAHKHLTQGVPGVQDWPVVMKPFSSESLSEAVAIALERAGKL